MSIEEIATERLNMFLEAEETILELHHVLEEIYNVCDFDYDTMPESMRREIFKAVLELADKGLDIK